jgi:hypothetical protein
MYKINKQINFNSEIWLEDKRYELVNLIFKNCFNIDNFLTNNNCIISYDDLQKKEIIEIIDLYRPAVHILFGTECVRSSLDSFYKKDKRPVVNLLKQILKHFSHTLESYSEYYSSNYGRKIYKTYYKIIKIEYNNNHCNIKHEINEIN